MLELTEIYSAKGALSSNQVVIHRPFRSVHHTASPVAIVGGGSGFPMPGEITLAHRGVLFLDELPQFPRGLLESLRQPLEDGDVHLSRTDGAATYPCEFILVAAMNPCPCGFHGESLCGECKAVFPLGKPECPVCGSKKRVSRCHCNASARTTYLSRVSGPILDRIDLKVHVSPLSAEERFTKGSGESSSQIRARVEEARRIQSDRFEGTDIQVNGRIPGGKVDEYCELQESALAAMRAIGNRCPEITTRGHDKLLKVSRTVADLHHSRRIYTKHIMEAAQLCGYEQVRELARFFEIASCPFCGDEIEGHHKFCPTCGKEQNPSSPGA